MLTTVSAYGRAGGSSRVRIFDWLAHLGLEADSHVYLGTATAGLRDIAQHPGRAVRAEVSLRRLASRVEGHTVLLSRNASSLSTGRLEDRLLTRAARGIYDIDDALMNLTGGPFPKSRIWERATRAADVAVVGNDYLADAASQHNTNVVMIPSCVEPAAYRVKSSFDVGDVPVAVWMGSPGTEFYLQPLADALLAEHHRSGLRLRVISRGSASLGPLDAMVDRSDWRIDTFGDDLADSDLGIMPLHEDPHWAQGKCAYKLLQYGAAGLPSIASPVGANADAITRLGAVSAADGAEWAEALRELIDASADRRRKMGERARSGVIDHYSFSAWAPTWRRAVLGTD